MGRLFMSKANRDTAFKAMSPEDRRTHRRVSWRNQLLHPMYVEDYEKETGRALTREDKGFGNTIYKTHFSTLYEIVKRAWPR